MKSLWLFRSWIDGNGQYGWFGRRLTHLDAERVLTYEYSRFKWIVGPYGYWYKHTHVNFDGRRKKRLVSAVIQLGKDIQGLKGGLRLYGPKKRNSFPAELKSLAHLPRRHYDYIQDYLKEFQDTAASLSGEQEELKKKAAKAAERQRRKIRRINSELKETDKMDTYKLYGDLLMIHAYDRPAHQSSLTVRNFIIRNDGRRYYSVESGSFRNRQCQ